jgi:uncharacterized protein (DUF2141 family)
MKKIILIISAVLLTNMLPAQTSVHDEKDKTGTLLVLVKGFTNTDGQLMVALYNTQGEFMSEKPYKGAIMKISASEELVRFENLPYGDYAVAAIHDINGDGKLDKNILGIPTEGYGFSNNVMGKYGPPEWIKASFVFDERAEARIINLEYGIPQSSKSLFSSLDPKPSK